MSKTRIRDKVSCEKSSLLKIKIAFCVYFSYGRNFTSIHKKKKEMLYYLSPRFFFRLSYCIIVIVWTVNFKLRIRYNSESHVLQEMSKWRQRTGDQKHERLGRKKGQNKNSEVCTELIGQCIKEEGGRELKKWQLAVIRLNFV